MSVSDVLSLISPTHITVVPVMRDDKDIITSDTILLPEIQKKLNAF